MIHFKHWIGIAFIVASHCYSQTTISGKFIGLSATDLDSASVLMKDGTGDTTYARASASKDGSFYLKTDQIGTLLAEFTCPHYKTLQAALLCDKPTTVNIDVTLSDSSVAQDISRLDFQDSLSLPAKYALLHLKSNRRLLRYWEEVGKPRSEGKDVGAIDWSVDTRSNEKALENEKEPVLRQELIMQYDELNALGASSASMDSLKKWLLEIPPTSPAWVYHMNLAWSSSKVYREDALQYLNDIIARHPNELFAKLIYNSAFSGCCGSSCSGIREKKYSSTSWSSQARPQLPMSRVGYPVTHFELRSIDDSSKTFSEKSMTGRIYMIDFWATWNEPSVTEMPYLHKAFERFKNQGLTIISVSMDDSSSIVSKYRKDNWAMPWQNALESSHTTGSLRWSFGVWGIPFPMLVSSKGIILALGDDLRGENLQRTLEKFIGK